MTTTGHINFVLAVFALLTGKGISNNSHQEVPGSPENEAPGSLNGSVLLVLGGGPSVLLDRQRESQVINIE